MPTLTVTPKGMLYLHASLREALGLRNGLPIDLIAPYYGSYYWYLDLRPSARCLIEWHNNTRMKARGIILPPGLVTEPLTLHLHTTTPEVSKWYPLLPNALTPQR